MAYTSRELNRLTAGIKSMNVVVLCSIEQQPSVKAALEKCFDSAEIVYAYDQRKPLSNSKYCWFHWWYISLDLSVCYTLYVGLMTHFMLSI